MNFAELMVPDADKVSVHLLIDFKIWFSIWRSCAPESTEAQTLKNLRMILFEEVICPEQSIKRALY